MVDSFDAISSVTREGMSGGRWVRELCDSVRVVRWWRFESEAGRDVSSFLDKSKAVYKPYCKDYSDYKQ